MLCIVIWMNEAAVAQSSERSISPAACQDANLRTLSGRRCPRPDQAFLQRLIDYGIATGYLRGRTVQRTSG